MPVYDSPCVPFRRPGLLVHYGVYGHCMDDHEAHVEMVPQTARWVLHTYVAWRLFRPHCQWQATGGREPEHKFKLLIKLPSRILRNFEQIRAGPCHERAGPELDLLFNARCCCYREWFTRPVARRVIHCYAARGVLCSTLPRYKYRQQTLG